MTDNGLPRRHRGHRVKVLLGAVQKVLCHCDPPKAEKQSPTFMLNCWGLLRHCDPRTDTLMSFWTAPMLFARHISGTLQFELRVVQLLDEPLMQSPASCPL